MASNMIVKHHFAHWNPLDQSWANEFQLRLKLAKLWYIILGQLYLDRSSNCDVGPTLSLKYRTEGQWAKLPWDNILPHWINTGKNAGTMLAQPIRSILKQCIIVSNLQRQGKYSANLPVIQWLQCHGRLPNAYLHHNLLQQDHSWDHGFYFQDKWQSCYLHRSSW